MQHKEATGAEVTVELDEDLICCGRHTILYRVATEQTNLRWGLVGPIPGRQIQRGGVEGVGVGGG